MDGSGDATARDYAPAAKEAPTPRPRFRPAWLPTLAAALLLPLFIAAGLWQWNKAATKAEWQQHLDALGAEPPVAMPAVPVAADTLRDRRIVARGRYEPQRQILIDNRTYREQAGFHVLTPLRIEGGDVRVLINRGWIPGHPEHGRTPEIATPPGVVEVTGVATVPPARFFTLKDEPAGDGGWRRVWQNLDLERYARAVDFPIQPLIVQLDPDSDAGGFGREWPRPDDKRPMHLGYALQWWAFAATTVALWLVHGFRRST